MQTSQVAPSDSSNTRCPSETAMAAPRMAAPQKEQLLQIIQQHRQLEGPLLPILHATQKALGFIPREAVPVIAEQLQMSRAEVHGVVSFYHFFRQQPAGKHTVQICRAESCQAMGSRQLEKQIQATLAIGYHQTSADQQFTLEPVYCLGNCACSPAIRIDDQIHGRVTSERFEELYQELTTDTLKVPS